MARKRGKSEYTKQRERILSFIRKASRRGYLFDNFQSIPVDMRKTPNGGDLYDNFQSIPTERQLRQQGYRGASLAAHTRRLKRITPKELYKQARFVDIKTGEILSGEEGRKFERARRAEERERRNEEARRAAEEYARKQAKRQADFARTVIHNYRLQILRFPKKVSEIVLSALDSAVATAGIVAVAWALENKAESLSDFLNRSVAFGDSIAAVIAYCQAMFGDLPGMQDNPEYTTLIEALEEEEGISE